MEQKKNPKGRKAKQPSPYYEINPVKPDPSKLSEASSEMSDAIGILCEAVKIIRLKKKKPNKPNEPKKKPGPSSPKEYKDPKKPLFKEDPPTNLMKGTLEALKERNGKGYVEIGPIKKWAARIPNFRVGR